MVATDQKEWKSSGGLITIKATIKQLKINNKHTNGGGGGAFFFGAAAAFLAFFFGAAADFCFLGLLLALVARGFVAAPVVDPRKALSPVTVFLRGMVG